MTIEDLITQISNSNIQTFFQQKIPSFRQEQEDLDYILPENGYESFMELQKLGEAE